MNASLKSAIVGSVLAVAILAGFILLGILLDRAFGYNRSLQSVFKAPYFELVLGGAIAGLIVGRLRFDWLPQPETQVSKVTKITATIARTFLASISFGAICGTITMLVFMSAMSLDPHSTVTSASELVRALLIGAAGGGATFALMCGVVGALWGVFKSKNLLKNPRTA